MTYDSVRRAAEVRMGGDSQGAWTLADALLAEVPQRATGQAATAGNGSDVTTVSLLEDIADRLDADGIETPQGNPYSLVTLRELRLAAMAWPPAERHTMAAFRTHQEVGKDPRNRAVLAALCQAVASQSWDEVPDEVDPEAWSRAILSVRRKANAGNRYPVSVNDWRTALKKRTNLPVSTRDGDMRDAITAVAEVRRLATYAVRIMASSPAPTGEWLTALSGFSDTLRMLAEYVDTLVQGGGITDDALSELLAGEGR